MHDFIKSLLNGFQILFRYAYPGFLFISVVRLLGIQNPFVCADIFGQSDQIWSLVVIYLLLSFIIYNFHRFFLHEYFLIVLFAFGITVPGRECKKEGKIPSLQKWLMMVSIGLLLLFCFISEICFVLLVLIIIFNISMVTWFVKKSNYMGYYKKFIKKRFTSKSEFSNYVDIRWATTHAIGITWWLPTLLYKYGLQFTWENGFISRHSGGFWIAIGILFLMWIYQVITLSVVEREFLNSERPHEIW